MSWSFRLFLAARLIGVLAFHQACAADAPRSGPPLEDAVRLADQDLPAPLSHAGSVAAAELPLPPLPVKPGKTVVLRFRMVSYAKTPAGCNMNATVEINGTRLGRYTAAGDERLLGRLPSFEFTTGHHGTSYPIFNGSLLTVMFAPDVDRGDHMSKDELGATFTLEIADVVRGVDGNSITFRNLRKPLANNARGDLIVRDIAVGWLDRQMLPQPPSAVPQRPPLATAVRVGSIGLGYGRAGGFSISTADRGELLVETGLGMNREVASELIASDTPRQAARAQVQVEQFRKDVAGLRHAVPGVKVLQRMHPAMEAVYRPAADRWPYAADAIRDERGGLFEDGSYSRAWLGSYVAKGWSILYFVPRSGSPYLAALLEGIRESLDTSGSDGIYCDEFSWAYPITIRRIGPGWIEAQQRLISCVSQAFPWPGPLSPAGGAAARIRIYRYEATGDRLGQPELRTIPAGQMLDVSVPQNGLVIAEITEPPPEVSR